VTTNPADTPEPPCWAVIFTSTRAPGEDGYAEAAERMLELAAGQPGYIGVETVRGEGGLGITVSYWESPEAIRAWREHPEHQAIQREGRDRWYRTYRVRVCRVERSYAFGEQGSVRSRGDGG